MTAGVLTIFYAIVPLFIYTPGGLAGPGSLLFGAVTYTPAAVPAEPGWLPFGQNTGRNPFFGKKKSAQFFILNGKTFIQVGC
jgi:hypothetical protein